MTEWQIIQQLKYLLLAETWPGGTAKVFHSDSVKITAAPQERAVEQMIMPACMIRPMGMSVDPEHQSRWDLYEAEFAVTVAVVNSGDPWGEAVMIGGQRTGQTSSVGRGLLEVEEILNDAIGILTTDTGVQIQHRMTSAAQARLVGNQYLLLRDYLYRAWATADRYYHPVLDVQEA